MYTSTRAAGANNGASWADSYTDLQAALGASVGGEIWVAEGVYYYSSSQPVLANVTFTGNTAPHGSSICNVGGGFKLVDGIVWDNTGAPEQI